MTDPTVRKKELTALPGNHETPEEIKVFRENEYERLTPSRGFRR